jgi:hypothetical protein
MKGKVYIKKVLIVWAIFLLTLTSIPLALGESSNTESFNSNENIISTRDSKHYTDCNILIFGRCNTVKGPLFWLFGLYYPIIERDFKIDANGELGETLNVIVLGPEFGTFISYENIEIDIYNAKGVLFWGGKSLILNQPLLFAHCKAADVWINY